jgi:hypothetical protein
MHDLLQLIQGVIKALGQQRLFIGKVVIERRPLETCSCSAISSSDVPLKPFWLKQRVPAFRKRLLLEPILCFAIEDVLIDCQCLQPGIGRRLRSQGRRQ